MIASRSLLALCFAVLTVTLTDSLAIGQRTWVVADDGTGDFADLPPAVAAAVPGDTVIVNVPRLLASPYTSPTIDKGIRLVVRGGWTSNGVDLRVVGIPQDQVFSLSGWMGNFDIYIDGCVGGVHLDRVLSLGPPLFGTQQRSVTITNCYMVTMNNSQVSDMTIVDSRVLLTTSGVDGRVTSSTSVQPAIRMTDSDVTLGGSFIYARATQVPVSLDVPAVVMTRGRLVISGSTLRGAPACCDPGSQPYQSRAILSDGGEVIYDQRTQFVTSVGRNPRAGTSTYRLEILPTMQVAPMPATLRNPVVPRVFGTPGASAFVLASLPADPIATPFGEFWLDPGPGHAQVIVSGTIGGTGEFFAGSYLQGLMSPGLAVTWQGVVVDGSGIHLTSPVITVKPVE